MDKITFAKLTTADFNEIDSLTNKLMELRGRILVGINGSYYYQRLAVRIYLSRVNGNRYGDICSI